MIQTGSKVKLFSGASILPKMALCNRYFRYHRYSRALCNRYCETESEDCCGHCMGRQSALEQLVPLPSISHLSHLPLSPISSILLFRPYFPSYFVSHLFHLTLSPIFSILLFLPYFSFETKKRLRCGGGGWLLDSVLT